LQVGFGGVGVVSQTGGEVIVQTGGVALNSGGYYLFGGTLSTPVLTKSPAAEFQFNGGTLSAGFVDFDLANNGGVIAPGSSPGLMQVEGDLTLNSGVLEIELGSEQFGQFDRVEVAGVAHLGGTLRVELVDLGAGPFTPQLGDQFPILAAQGGTAGMFNSLELPALAPGLAWSLNPGAVTTFLSVVDAATQPNADFNGDGAIDGADFLAWQRGFGLSGQTNNMNGDANVDGLVDAADLTVWQSQFGDAAFTPAASQVPEPAPRILVAIVAAFIGWRLQIVKR
jgi:hypothetical protein